jgi:hypothetical protein
MPITGCTIQEILGSDTPNQGRVKINKNFDCVVSAITNTIASDTYVTGGTYNSTTESIDFSGTTLFTPFSVDVSDLLDDTNTFTTGVTLNGTVLEFDRNDTLNAYGVELSGLTSSFITGQTLSETLANGNETDGNNIEMTTGDAIVAANGNTINLDVTVGPFTNSVVIADAVGSGLGIAPGYGVELNNSAYGNYVRLEDTGLVDISTGGEFLLNANSGVGLGVFGSGDISIFNNSITNKTSSNINKNSIFIGTRNSTINSGVTNSVVLGGVGITATQNNTIYVPNLNIGILGTGTSVSNLGIDSNGFVVSAGTDTNTFTTGATLNGTILEFDRTDTTNAYSVELSGLTSSFTGQSLSQTLTIGNNTGGNDIITDIDDVIISVSGGTLLNLRDSNLDGHVLLGQPSSIYGGKGGFGDGGGILFLSPNGVTLAHDGGSFNDFYLYTEKNNYGQLARFRDSDNTYYGFNLYGNNTFQNYSTGVSIKDNETNSFTSLNKNNPAIIIGSKNSIINSGITNSVIIGGQNITATQNNTLYVDNLNINTLGTGTSVNNLGIDSNGFIVSGQTSLSKVVVTFTPGTVGVPNTLTHNLGTTDIIIQLWDLTTNELINTTINNVTTTQVDVTFGTNPSGDVKAIII